MADLEMKLRDDHGDAGVLGQDQEGFVGVHIGAGQHSEVGGACLQAYKNHYSLFPVTG